MRHHLYKDIHKAIRLQLSELVVQAGKTDFTDDGSKKSLRERLEGAFALLAGHASHESAFIGPVLAEVRPDVHDAIETAHEDQDVVMALLRDDLAAASDAMRGHDFVVSLSRFVGDLWMHMADEEQIVMRALWDALDDAAIVGIHQRLLASIAPREAIEAFRWMIPAMNHPERVGLIARLPAPVAPVAMDLACSTLDPAELARLQDDVTPPSKRAA
jgi:hypothetical protein